MIGVVQFVVDVFLLAAVVGLFLDRRAGRSRSDSRDEVKRDLALLKSEMEHLRESLKKVIGEVEEKLKSVEALSEQTHKILKQGRNPYGSFPLTQEETELKEALYSAIEKEQIPSLSELENTKLNLQKEVALNLKTLLKDQLL